MDLRQLQALLAVAEHQSFSAAARSLHTVQSNVSTHVARLEQELGSQLINRSHGTLTVEGEIVADRARRVVAEIRSIEDDLNSVREEITGVVRIGVIGTTARWLVPPLLVAMKSKHPMVEMRVIEATTTALIPMILSDQIDTAIVNLPVDNPDIDIKNLFSEKHIVVAPLHHPLANYESVSLEELAQHQVLLPPTGTAFRDTIDADAERNGVKLKVLAEVDGLRLLTSLAFQGFGPAIVPAGATPQWLTGDWRRVNVDGLSERRVGLALPRRTMPSAPTRATIDVVCDAVAAAKDSAVIIEPDPSISARLNKSDPLDPEEPDQAPAPTAPR